MGCSVFLQENQEPKRKPESYYRHQIPLDCPSGQFRSGSLTLLNCFIAQQPASRADAHQDGCWSQSSANDNFSSCGEVSTAGTASSTMQSLGRLCIISALLPHNNGLFSPQTNLPFKYLLLNCISMQHWCPCPPKNPGKRIFSWGRGWRVKE